MEKNNFTRNFNAFYAGCLETQRGLCWKAKSPPPMPGVHSLG